MIFLSIQAFLCLLVFECARRNPTLEVVYDRRRYAVTPSSRVPPPLPQRRGLCHGWLALEWWRIRLTDEDYRRLAWQEYRERQEEREVEKRKEQNNRLTKDDDQRILEEAVRQCNDESPFFDEEETTTELQEMYEVEVEPTSSPIEEAGPDPLPAGLTTVARGVLRRKESPKDDKAPLESDEEQRLARLQFDIEDRSEGRRLVSTVATTCWGFVKTKVLMIRAANDQRAQPQQKGALRAHDFVAYKITRRPLTKEQRELLRCIGLDLFMVLQFLRFGFRISFLPFVLSLFTLLPLYRTGDGIAQVGFFSVTVLAVEEDGSWRYVVVTMFVILQYLYMLRQLWVLWEIFLPLRFDFLENGDFKDDKYKEQYRETCVVENIPQTLQSDKALFDFFATIFPGQVRRAEVLLNAEALRSLMKRRLKHIVAFEDCFAKKVHRRAEYLRALREYETSRALRKFVAMKPHKPRDPIVTVFLPTEDVQNTSISTEARPGKDCHSFPKLKWHHQ